MEERFYINFRKDVIIINAAELVPNNRKSPLRISEDQAERIYKPKFERLKKEVSKLVSFNLFFSEEDYYDHTEYYEVPRISFDKERKERKYRISSYETNTIPKEWTREFNVRLAPTNRVSQVIDTLSILGFRISEKEIKEIRKALKNGTSYSKEY